MPVDDLSRTLGRYLRRASSVLAIALALAGVTSAGCSPASQRASASQGVATKTTTAAPAPANTSSPTASIKLASLPIAVRASKTLSATSTISGSIPAKTQVRVEYADASASSGSSWKVAGQSAASDGAGSYVVKVKLPRGTYRVRSTLAVGDSVLAASASQPVNVVGKKVVALTFDDGPSLPATLKVLATLQKYGIHATFFESARLANRHKKVVRQVAAAGMTIGSHGGTHADLTKLSGAKLAKEIALGRDTIGHLTGRTPAYMRPPYGAMNRAALAAVHSAGMHSVVWTVDTEDWTGIPTAEIVRRAVEGTDDRDGSIVLMHDSGMNQKRTPPAVPTIIEELRAKGFDFVTLDEMHALGLRIPEGLTSGPIKQ